MLFLAKSKINRNPTIPNKKITRKEKINFPALTLIVLRALLIWFFDRVYGDSKLVCHFFVFQSVPFAQQ